MQSHSHHKSIQAFRVDPRLVNVLVVAFDQVAFYVREYDKRMSFALPAFPSGLGNILCR